MEVPLRCIPRTTNPARLSLEAGMGFSAKLFPTPFEFFCPWRRSRRSFISLAAFIRSSSSETPCDFRRLCIRFFMALATSDAICFPGTWGMYFILSTIGATTKRRASRGSGCVGAKPSTGWKANHAKRQGIVSGYHLATTRIHFQLYFRTVL